MIGVGKVRTCGTTAHTLIVFSNLIDDFPYYIITT